MPPRTSLEYVLEAISIGALLACAFVVVGAWGALPEHIPSHFGAAGSPDAYGSKGNVTLPAVLALVMYVLFSLVQRTSPRKYNYPVDISADNAVEHYRAARQWLAVVKVAICLALACGTWLTVQVALGHRQGLGVWFVPGTLMALLSPVVWYASTTYRRRKT